MSGLLSAVTASKHADNMLLFLVMLTLGRLVIYQDHGTCQTCRKWMLKGCFFYRYHHIRVTVPTAEMAGSLLICYNDPRLTCLNTRGQGYEEKSSDISVCGTFETHVKEIYVVKADVGG